MFNINGIRPYARTFVGAKPVKETTVEKIVPSNLSKIFNSFLIKGSKEVNPEIVAQFGGANAMIKFAEVEYDLKNIDIKNDNSCIVSFINKEPIKIISYSGPQFLDGDERSINYKNININITSRSTALGLPGAEKRKSRLYPFEMNYIRYYLDKEGNIYKKAEGGKAKKGNLIFTFNEDEREWTSTAKDDAAASRMMEILEPHTEKLLNELDKLQYEGVQSQTQGLVDLKITIYFNTSETLELCDNSSIKEFKIAQTLVGWAKEGLHKTGLTPYFNPKKITTKNKNQLDNIIVKLRNNAVIYLPKIDRRNIIEKQIEDSYDVTTKTFDIEKLEFKSDIIYWNVDQGLLSYVNKEGIPSIFLISGAIELTNRAKYNTAKAEYDSILQKRGTLDINKSFDEIFKIALSKAGIAEDEYNVMNAYSAKSLQNLILRFERYLGEDKARKLFKAASDILLNAREGYKIIADPLRRYSTIAIFKLGEELVGKIGALETEIKEQIEKLNSATIDDLPVVPDNLDPSITYFPHQAEAISKLNLAGDTAILSVATGGGKTLMLLADMVNKLSKGEILKPLLVIPDSLTTNWFNEIRNFSKMKMNCMILSSDTEDSWVGKFPKDVSDDDVIKKLDEVLGAKINSAPPNTIFVTTYSWITKKSNKFKIGGVNTHVFPYVNFLSNYKWDYIGLDEAHKIKKQSSQRTQACYALRSGIKIRRIATGTLAPTRGLDLVGQIGFLDPSVLGNEKDFRKKYCLPGKRGGYSNTLKDGAYEEVLRDISQLGNITYSRKDWFWILPKIEDKFHSVEMNEAQMKVYYDIVEKTLNSLESASPEDKEELNRYMEENPDEEIHDWYLARLQPIQRFLIDPSTSPLSNLLSINDKRPPKLSKIIEILDEHFAKTPNEKVLILQRYKGKVLQDIMKGLPDNYKKMAIVYSGGMVKNLERFKKDANIKILVGSDESLTEGHNLQVASRMIRLDIPWSSGAVDQVVARIYRPAGRDKETGELKKQRELVTIDWILVDKTLDVLKVRRVMRNMQKNSVLSGIITMEQIPEEFRKLPELKASLDFLRNPVKIDPLTGQEIRNDIPYTIIMSSFKAVEERSLQAFRKVENDEWQKKNDEDPDATKWVEIKTTGETMKGTDTMEVPWPEGLDIPKEDGRVLKDVLEEVDNDYSKLIMYECITEFGKGIITKIKQIKEPELDELGNKTGNMIDSGEFTVLVKILEGDRKGQTVTLPGTKIGVVGDKAIKKDYEDLTGFSIPYVRLQIGSNEYAVVKEQKGNKVAYNLHKLNVDDRLLTINDGGLLAIYKEPDWLGLKTFRKIYFKTDDKAFDKLDRALKTLGYKFKSKGKEKVEPIIEKSKIKQLKTAIITIGGLKAKVDIKGNIATWDKDAKEFKDFAWFYRYNKEKLIGVIRDKETGKKVTRAKVPKLDLLLSKIEEALYNLGYQGDLPEHLKEKEEQVNKARVKEGKDKDQGKIFKKVKHPTGNIMLYYHVYPNGEIYQYLPRTDSEELKLVYSNGTFITPTGRASSYIAKNPKAYKKFIKALTELGFNFGKKSKTVEPEIEPEVEPKKVLKKDILDKLKEKVKKSKKDIGEYYFIKDTFPDHFRLEYDGNVYPIYQDGKRKLDTPEYIYDEERKTWFTQGGRPSNKIKNHHIDMYRWLMKMRKKYADEITEPTPTIDTPDKLIKKSKEPSLQSSTDLKTLIFAGNLGIGIEYEPDSESEILKLAKPLGYDKFEMYRTIATKSKLVLFYKLLKSKKFVMTEKNKDVLMELFEEINKPLNAILRSSILFRKEIYQVHRKNWITDQLYIIPVLIGDVIELWIPAMKEKVIKSIIAELKMYKFKKDSVLINILKNVNEFKNESKELTKTLKVNKIVIKNELDFNLKVDILEKKFKQ